MELEEYVIERHEMFLRILRTSRKTGKISENQYNHLMMKVFEPKTWEEAFTEFEQYGNEIVHAIIHHAEFDILERLAKGAEYIEKEIDAKKKALYLQRYNELELQLDSIRKGKIA